MYPVNGLEDNNNNNKTVIIKKFRTSTRIHEHDFISITTEKEYTSIICCICGSIYCKKCGKLVMIYDKNYMQHNIYN
jgi:hypothetical protein